MIKKVNDLQVLTCSLTSLGLRWEDRGDYGYFPLEEQWKWYGIDIALYLFLTWFFDAVIYLKLKPWFMFTKSYWVGNKKRVAKVRCGLTTCIV
jgi:hypothetical protein